MDEAEETKWFKKGSMKVIPKREGPAIPNNTNVELAEDFQNGKRTVFPAGTRGTVVGASDYLYDLRIDGVSHLIHPIWYTVKPVS